MSKLKKRGILHVELSKAIAELGHTDKLVICDAGLPIPLQANRIDLALTRGIPSFIETLRSVLPEIVVEQAIIATEIKEYSPHLLQTIMDEIGDTPIIFIPHAELKRMLPEAKGIVRTGEFTPYANIILVSGVQGLFK